MLSVSRFLLGSVQKKKSSLFQLQSPLPAPAPLSLSFPLVPAADLRARHESFDDFDEDDEDDEEIARGVRGSLSG